jgi:hypothetical protein
MSHRLSQKLRETLLSLIVKVMLIAKEQDLMPSKSTLNGPDDLGTEVVPKAEVLHLGADAASHGL